MSTPFGRFGLPPDGVAWAALVAAAVIAGAVLLRPGATRIPKRLVPRAVMLLAVVAAALSIGYVSHYLRGGPRIIDATSYFLEARALSHGLLSMPIEAPSGSFRGRFLVTNEAGTAMSVIFPPGYPAVLALGFLAGAPMVVGPLIAAGLVIATFALARRVFGRQDVALTAAALSVVSAALRYHTADTMAHGWAALLLTVAMTAALAPTSKAAGLAGLAAGWLVATRPVTGAVGLVLLVGLEARCWHGRDSPDRLRRALCLVAGLAPGLLLLSAHQRAATGSWVDSAQLFYYSLADGPPGCFRYGFGPGVGCLFEHGEFVRRYLPDGYGAVEAVGTTLRRLRYHVLDVANFEPLALLVPYAAIATWKRPAARMLSIGVVCLVAAYVPFYFDGNYPGGGARMFVEAIPLEHVLMGAALVRLRVAGSTLAACLAGFALHGSFDHEALARREGGRPMFEPRAVLDAGVDRGLVLVGTDHGFNLGFDPEATPDRGIVVARAAGAARESLLWERLGRPPTFHYVLDVDEPNARPRLVRVHPQVVPGARQEAESEWPPFSLSGGFVHPDFVAPAPQCESNGRGLRLRARPGGRLATTIEIFAPAPGYYWLATRWVSAAEGVVDVMARVGRARWGGARRATAGQCLDWSSPPLRLPGGPTHLQLEASGENAVLDFVLLWPASGER